MNKTDMHGSNSASSDAKGGIFHTKAINSHFPIPSKDEILVCPIGGVAEIGMNWTLYGHDGRWLLVDAGLGFAKGIPAVSAIMPDPQTLEPILSCLDGLVITHAHEDHIGAVHRVWEQIRCPIYATPFAAELISLRMKEMKISHVCEINRFTPGTRFSAGSFVVDTIELTHSTVECVGLLLETPVGRVFHTGDWKFDDAPVLGTPVDKDRLRDIGRDGVLLMVSDSTNAHRRGSSMSEGNLLEGFKRVMADHRGTIVVSCFASNLARVATVLKAARLTGRYVALLGRAMLVNEEIARNLGILPEEDAPMEMRHINHCDEYQRVILCTGTQGEPLAGLAKIIHGEHSWLPKLGKNDVIVHSARAIPGNEALIEELLDKARGQGATVYEQTYKHYPLHATGHGSGTELAEMYEMIQPKFSIPVHGGPDQLASHEEIARAAGVDTHVPSVGSVLSVTRSGVEVIATVEVNLICQYNTELGQPLEFGPWNEDVKQHLLEPLTLALAC